MALTITLLSVSALLTTALTANGQDNGEGLDADRRVEGARVTAEKVQSQQGKRIKVRVRAGADEDVNAFAFGAIAVGRKGATAKFREPTPPTRRIQRDETKRLTLTLGPKASRRVHRALRKGRRVRANVDVQFVDNADNSQTLGRVIRLVR